MRNVERAKKIATEKGINVSFVCREIGKSRGYISQMIVSGRDFPDEMLVPVANALGVTVEELIGEEQKEKPSTPEDVEREAHSQAILDKYNINSNNVLFLDDNKDNIESSGEMGINTILVNKNMNIYDEICKYMIKYE